MCHLPSSVTAKRGAEIDALASHATGDNGSGPPLTENKDTAPRVCFILGSEDK